MYLKAHAKINLYIDVLGLRSDGFHELDMISLPLELHDSISFNVLPYAHDSYVTCDVVDIKETKYNLINKTIKIAREKYKFPQNFAISVHKEIPIKAGLGGGSSNAAATLKAICNVLKIKETKENLIDIAKEIGADVPFCLFNKPMHIKGMGEILEPIKVHHPFYVLIVMPEKGLSTKTVFDASNDITLKCGDISKAIAALENGDDESLAASMHNALEEVSISFVPEILTIEKMMKEDGLKLVLMSGSGSAVFALSTDHHKLQKLAKKYDKLNYDTYLTRTLTIHE